MKGSVNYDFSPGDAVFVVLNNNAIYEGRVVQVDIKVYEKNDFYVQDLRFLIAIKDSLDDKKIQTTAWVYIDEIFETIEEASDKVKQFFSMTVT